jgi:ornithine cyclodeaminase
MGTGVQARLQLEAAYLVRPFKRVLLWGRDPEKAALCAADIAKRLPVEARAASAEETVRESQLLITATPAREPIVQAQWLHPGLHITAMGSDQADKNEIAPDAIGRADLYVCDRVSQAEKLGELRAARQAGWLVDREVPELGAIIVARRGRTSDAEITVCDLTGTGAQDTAIATHAFGVAMAAGAGIHITI